MTDTEKKMKRYVNAVERRLDLPGDIRARVMSDFSSSIQARRESGMTDAEIYAELGTPGQAAADLNEQMKDYTYRKSPWRFLFAALAAYGAAELLGSLAGFILYLFMADPLFHAGEASSIGIIGGADGPTAIFITTPSWTGYVLPVAALIIGIWGFMRLRKCRRK